MNRGRPGEEPPNQKYPFKEDGPYLGYRLSDLLSIAGIFYVLGMLSAIFAAKFTAAPIVCPAVTCPEVICPGVTCPDVVCPELTIPDIFSSDIICSKVVCPENECQHQDDPEKVPLQTQAVNTAEVESLVAEPKEEGRSDDSSSEEEQSLTQE